MRYKRILLKLSGGALAADGQEIFDIETAKKICQQVVDICSAGVEVAIVVGGGNIFKGTTAHGWTIDRAEADNVGMLGTIINAVLLRAVLKTMGSMDVRVMTSFPLPSMAEPFIRLRADSHLKKGAVVVLGGGNGQPYVTTDYPSAQRAVELNCDALLAAKDGVDGVYTADPRRDPTARRYRQLSYDDAQSDNIRVMDRAAIILAEEHSLPIHVFSFADSSAIFRICRGDDVGTIIAPGATTAF